MMRWERVGGVQGGKGPGKRWGHTCNAVAGGRLLYVFGGYGKDNCQTNRVHVFDTFNRLWSEALMKGVLPTPRDSHSCTTIGDNLFVFGGTDGRKPLNDLHILDTSSNTWISPSLRGDAPEAREGHSAALIGKRLFIFGGCGKFENNEVYYDDLYILNTETFLWKRVTPSGTPPTKRDSHTCSSWKNKIIVIGGEDSSDYYLSDVHILDADTLVWCKLNTMGQLLPPRAGHTTIAFGKNLFVFGGFSDEQNLYDDVYMLDVDAGMWTKVMTAGEGPSARFSMAGDSLDPHMRGVLVFMGGCNKNLEALEDIYYLYTGLACESEREQRRIEKLSLRKQLKLKCRGQNAVPPAYDKALGGLENSSAIRQSIPVSCYNQPSRQSVYLNEYQTPLGKKTFQAKVTKNFPDGYTIETVIDGKPLRGVLFSNKLRFNKADIDDSNREPEAMETGTRMNNDQDSSAEAAGNVEQNVDDTGLTSLEMKNPKHSELPREDTSSEMKIAAFNASVLEKVDVITETSKASATNVENIYTSDVQHLSTNFCEEDASATKETVNPA